MKGDSGHGPCYYHREGSGMMTPHLSVRIMSGLMPVSKVFSGQVTAANINKNRWIRVNFCLREAGAGGSNPLTPTISYKHLASKAPVRIKPRPDYVRITCGGAA